MRPCMVLMRPCMVLMRPCMVLMQACVAHDATCICPIDDNNTKKTSVFQILTYCISVKFSFLSINSLLVGTWRLFSILLLSEFFICKILCPKHIVLTKKN
jgi:hypothetical protein